MTGSSSTVPPRVLIVDDDEDSLVIYEKFLWLAGFATSRAASAMEAVSRATAAPPAAVLLDLVLPDMHGSELALLFREIPALQRVPIVGITARVTPALLAKPEAMNCTRLLVKPVASRQLADAVRDAIAEIAPAA
jgi:CheY-like chemotaxis protein